MIVEAITAYVDAEKASRFAYQEMLRAREALVAALHEAGIEGFSL